MANIFDSHLQQYGQHSGFLIFFIVMKYNLGYNDFAKNNS